MKQITTELEIIGKKIKQIIDFDYNRKIFCFRDNTFAVYKIENGEIEFSPYDEIVWNYKKYYQYGLISKKESESRQKKHDAALLNSRKIQYEILKKEFGEK